VNLAIISGSRADYGLLQWPTKVLKEDPFFAVAEVKIWGMTAPQALQAVGEYLADARPDYVLLLGDRFEIMAAAWAAHLQRIPIAHIGGGDVTLGSYDDAMRDCISRMATLHFTTSLAASFRLENIGLTRGHLVGSPGVDYLMHAPWRVERPITEPYVLVAYYPETIDGTVDLKAVEEAIAGRKAIWCTQNLDAGSDAMPQGQEFTHDEFLNLLANCEEFIGNSSAILYEAPFLGVKTRMIGKRQRGRVVPFGDGEASNRIRDILKQHG